MKGCVLRDGDPSEPFNINTGVKQGCVIAPTLFYISGCLSITSED